MILSNKPLKHVPTHSSKSKKKLQKHKPNTKKLSNQDSYIELSGNESRSTRLDSDMNSTKPKKLPLAKQISMFNHLKALVAERKKDKAIIQAMLHNKKTRLRKSRKTLSHFDFITKRIAKNKIFRMVKFVINEHEMDKYLDESSIGYHFLKELKKEDQIHHSKLFEGNEKTIWDNAKYLVHEAIGEKRNARQTQIKKAWKGLYSLVILVHCDIF